MRIRSILLLNFCLTWVLLLPAQNVTVTGALVGNGSYATLSSAFWAIGGSANYGCHINVRVVANTNESSTAILQNGYFSTLSLTSGGGAVRGNVAGPLISMSNVSRVFIQGLTMTNFSTSTASDVGTLRLNGNCNIVYVTNCNVLGAGKSPTSGAISIVSGLYGNGSISIEGCNILSLSGTTQGNGIYALGTPSANNFQIQIKNNTIHGFFLPDGNSHGVYIGPGNTDCEIFQNNITNAGNQTHTVGGRWCGILLDESGSFGGNVINANTISGFSLVGSGPQSKLLPIVFSNADSVRPSVVKNNVIESMTVGGPVSGVGGDSPFIGILLQGGNTTIGMNGGNRIGKTNASANILVNSSAALLMDVYGIYAEGSGEAKVLNSEIGGISAGKTGAGAVNLHGIRCNTSKTKITGSVIGYPTAPLVVTSGDSTSAVVGISVFGSQSDILDNSVSYLRNGAPNAQTGENAAVIGIKRKVDAIGPNTQNNISNNAIFALSSQHLHAATSTIGLYVYGEPSLPVLIDRLNIHSLKPNTNSPQSKVIGIYVDGGENTVQNSSIRLGMNESGASINNIGDLIGIQDEQGMNSYFHNSVFLGGDNLSGSTASSCFKSQVIGQPTNLINNILYNARNNRSGSGIQYAIQVSSGDALASDYNILYATGGGALYGKVGGVNIPNFNMWLTYTGLDSHSLNRNPNFVNPMGNVTLGDLHLGPSSPAEGSGVWLGSITADIDGESRNGSTPSDIGADGGNYQPQLAFPAEITVRGKGIVIADGDMSISGLDGTALDSIYPCSSTLEQTFWIENESNDTLELYGLTLTGPDTAMYQLTHLPSNLFRPNTIDSFSIRFAPYRHGSHQVTIEIQSNDADEASYDFRVGGYVLQDTTPPNITCHSTSVTVSPLGDTLIDLSWVLDSTYDACGIDTVTLSKEYFGCADLGTQSLLLRAYDDAGNVSTCTTSIIVSAMPFSMSVQVDTTYCGYHLACAADANGRGAVQAAGGCLPYQYVWSSGETTAQAQQLVQGKNYVTVTDASGIITMDSLLLNAPPPLAITLEEMVASCPYSAGGALEIQVEGGLTCNAYALDWSSGDTTRRVEGLLPGIYGVTLTDVGGCQTAASFPVTQRFYPTPQILQHLDTLHCTAPFAAYQWYRDGQAITYMRDPWIVPDSNGSYHVEVTDTGGCTAISNTLWMTSIQQIGQGHFLDNLSVAPNPAQGFVTLVAGDPVRTGVRVGFYDAAGRLVRKLERSDLEDEWVIDIHDLSAGLYFLNVSAKNGAYKVLRLLVQR